VIGISKLYLGASETSDVLRYGWRAHPEGADSESVPKDRKPVVVWNMTARCNLNCRHCYAEARNGENGNELTNSESLQFIDDLADFGCPVLLFSGGEPLMHPYLSEYVHHAVTRGMRAVVSTNGTLITERKAAELKGAGVAYVGVSLDGLNETHDKFRSRAGAFEQALEGIRACQKVSLKVGLRFTLTRWNLADLDGVFDLLITEQIPRACFYHLVYTGRGSSMRMWDLSHQETRQAVDQIIDRTSEIRSCGIQKEILTVDNHCDGPYVYFRMLREQNARAGEVLNLLRANGGNASGIGIGCIGWDGNVYADQFWRNHPLGNVHEQPFSRIWSDGSGEGVLSQLRNRRQYIAPRCRTCRFYDCCGGNFRARAEAAYSDMWACDPACYLTDSEIAGML
jgi:Fe-coproporphyrin III synthase